MKTSSGLCVLVAGMMLVSGFAVIGIASEDSPITSDDSVGIPSPYAGSSPRQVVVEQFTSDWCVFCPPQTHSMERLYEEYFPNGPIVIEYHTSDEFTTGTDVSARAAKYSVPGIPSVIFDGGGPFADGHLRGSGGTSKYGVYVADKADYLEETTGAGAGAPCTITVDGDIQDLNGNLHVHLDFTDTPTQASLELTTVIVEDTKHHFDGNTNEVYAHHRVYNGVCRDVLTPIALPGGLGPGSHLEYNVSFTLNPAWYPYMDQRDVSAVIFVQSTTSYGYRVSGTWYYNYPILQATKYEFVPAEILFVNCDDTDLIDNYADFIVEELVKVKRKAHTWDTIEVTDTAILNEKTMPTAADMADYSTVIWYCGLDTSTLSAADRTNIQIFLDGGGNVFLTGANIAQDANTNGWLTWLQTNFKSTFVAASSGGTTINGVGGDPIGNGLAGLPVNATSPDSINAVAGGTISFTYNNGPNMAVRSTHTGGGRTVFFAADYFTVTSTIDADANDETVMMRILNWQDAAVGPEVTVLDPDGGETLTPATTFPIRWAASDTIIPEDGIDVYYCTDYPTATWQSVMADTVNDGVYMWTVPSVNSATCRVRIVATDAQGLTGEDISNADFTIGSVAPTTAWFNITVSATGWTLVSLPLTGPGTLPGALTDKAGTVVQWTRVMWYNPTDHNDSWKQYNTAWAAGMNDLTTVDVTKGVWLYVPAGGLGDGQICVGGTGYSEPTSTQITLRANSWNLVGFPSDDTLYTVAMLKAAILSVTNVEKFTGVAPYYQGPMGDGEAFEPGKAYWVYNSGAETIWTKTW